MTEKTAKKQIGLPLKILIAMVLGAALGFVIGEGNLHPVYRRCVHTPAQDVHLSPYLRQHNQRHLTGCGHVPPEEGRRLLPSLLGCGVYPSGYNGPGLGFHNQAGVGINLGSKEVPVVDVNLLESLVNWVPNNPFAAFGREHPLQIIVFALICGLILATFKDTDHGKRLFNLFDSLNEFFISPHSRLGHKPGSLRSLCPRCKHHRNTWINGPLRTRQDACNSVSSLRHSDSDHLSDHTCVYCQSEAAAALQKHLSRHGPCILDLLIQRDPSSR